MRLVIRARALHQAALSQTIVGEFDERGGTIGRSDSNTMTLPDPERHVSRLQAQVSFVNGAFQIRNVGSSNPILVNGRLINPGEALPVQGGDRMTIGGYELQADHEQTAAPGFEPARAIDPRTVIGASASEGRTHPPGQTPGIRGIGPGLLSGGPTAAGPASAPRSGPPSSPPRSAPVAPPPMPSPADPFADLFGPAGGGAPAFPGPPVDASPFGPLSPPPAPSAPAAPRLPDDFDPFAPPTTIPAATGGRAPAAGQPSLGEMVGDRGSSPGSIDSLFGLESPGRGPGGGTDPLQDFLAGTPAPPAGPAAPIGAAADDPFAFLDATRRPPATAPSPDHAPLLEAAWQPPPLVQPARAVAPAQVPAGPAVDAATRQALWAAFCDGAGLELANHPPLTPELMRVIGATLREAVTGAVQLSAVRTTAKQEMHVPVTTIQARENNPLKFAPDTNAALLLLLQPPVRGFLDGPDAMRDLMTDVLGHTAGTMAGMRAAIQGMLQRFEPARLEAQLARGGMLESLVPGSRRGRLWELYLQHYGRISEGAREDFHELFGKAFVSAYEEQSGRMTHARGRQA